MNDEEEKQLRLELLAADLKLRRKQEFWETPRNIAILVGVTAAIAAAIGFWLGRESAPPAPVARPVFGIGMFNGVIADHFLDAVESAGIVVIAAVLIYVVIRLDRTLTAAARDLKGAIGQQQQAMEQAITRTWARVEAIEQRIEERNRILPTAKLGLTLDEIQARLDRLEER